MSWFCDRVCFTVWVCLHVALACLDDEVLWERDADDLWRAWREVP